MASIDLKKQELFLSQVSYQNIMLQFIVAKLQLHRNAIFVINLKKKVKFIRCRFLLNIKSIFFLYFVRILKGNCSYSHFCPLQVFRQPDLRQGFNNTSDFGALRDMSRIIPSLFLLIRFVARPGFCRINTDLESMFANRSYSRQIIQELNEIVFYILA